MIPIFSLRMSAKKYKKEHAMKFLGSVEDFRSECTLRSRKGVGNIHYVYSRF